MTERNLSDEVHWHRELGGDTDQLLEQSEAALRRAAGIAAQPAAGGEFLYLQLDALVNLGWLGYYAGQQGLSDEAEDLVEAAAGGYFLQPRREQEAGAEDPHVLVWPQLGKLHVLKALWAYQRFQGQNDEKNLRETGQNCTLAFEYNQRIGSKRVESNNASYLRAQKLLFRQLKTLRPEQLRILSKAVVETETEYHIPAPSAFQEFLKRRSLWYLDESGEEGL